MKTNKNQDIIDYQQKIFEESAASNIKMLREWFPFTRYQFVAFNPKNGEVLQNRCETKRSPFSLAKKGWIVHLNDRRSNATLGLNGFNATI